MGEAFANLFAFWPMVYLIAGTALGITVGSIPGLTASMLIALSLPLTFYMSSVDAMTLLIGMYVGGISGGLIAATLLRMPGTPAVLHPQLVRRSKVCRPNPAKHGPQCPCYPKPAIRR